MIKTIEQQHRLAPFKVAVRSNYINQALSFVTLSFLMFGYVGVNLLDMTPTSIMAIRLGAVFSIALLLTINNRINKITRPILILVLISAVGAITSSISLNILFICLFLLAVRSLSIIFLATASSYILGATLVVSLALVQFGIVENSEDTVGLALELGDELRTRMTFGYKNVNAFSAVVSGFCLLFMAVGKHALIRYAIAIFTSYAFYVYTDSRTMLLTTISFVLFSMMFFILVNYRRIFYSASIVVIGVPLALSIMPDMIINQFPLIDLVFSGRFSFISAYLSEMPTYRMLIGGMEPSIGLTIDNSFALIAGAVGIPFTIYLAFRIFLIAKHCADIADYRTYAFILSFWLYSFSESSIVRPESLICLIFWMIIFKSNKINPKLSQRIIL